MVLRLDPAQLEELAGLVAVRVLEELGRPSGRPAESRLVDAAAVATRFGVTREYVYEHAGDLGAVRLGDGPRARLRFDMEEVAMRLTGCAAGSESPDDVSPAQAATRRSRRRRGLGTAAQLLPIRGEE